MSDKAWSGKTGGTRWMQLFLIKVFKLIHVSTVYPIMYLWIIGYIIGVSSARRGIYYYWRTRRGFSVNRSIWHLWLNYVEFGKAILDRFAAWAGRRVETTLEGIEIIDKVLEQNRGFIVLSTHIGNQELAGYNFKMPKPMYALVYMGDTETVNARRTALFESMGIHTIPYRQDGSHIFDMHNALSNGNILSIHGDRMLNGVRQIEAPILGEQAAFPEGPFYIAAVEKVPVLTLFMMRNGLGKYHLFVKQISNGDYTASNRKEQEKELLTSYIKVIEQIVEHYPHQWFHFYEFWKKSTL